MSPKIVDKDKKRTDIAKTALALFARQGYENTAVREIAVAAGMGKGTFYDYFADKDEILNEIARLMFDRWRNSLAAELKKTDDPIEGLRALGALGVASAHEFQPMTVMYIDLWRLGVNKAKTPPFMALFKDFITEARNLAAGLIERAKARGLVRPDVDSEALGAALIAFIDGAALHGMVYREELNLARVWQSFFENFILGMK